MAQTRPSSDQPKADDTAPTPEASHVLGKRELVDRVVAASGIKKRAVRPVVEAVLNELGSAFSRGDTLNLQPFGKGMVKSHKDLENAEVIEVRLRRSKLAIKAAAAAPRFSDPADDDPRPDPLAEAAE